MMYKVLQLDEEAGIWHYIKYAIQNEKPHLEMFDLSKCWEILSKGSWK